MTDPPCETCALSLTIPLFESEVDVRPRREDTTWGELRARLLRFELRDEKSGPAWSPVRYADGATRGNAGVEAISVAVMDVDDGTDPELVHRHLSDLGLEHVIHSTHSSTPERPKFRAIVPLRNPCSVSSWPAIFPRLCALLTDGHTDPGTKDAARLFFLPSARPDGRTFTYSGHGRAILPGDLPPLVEEQPKAPVVRVEARSDGKLPHGRHHEVIVSTAASLASRIGGLSEPQAVEMLRGALAPLLDDVPTHDAEIREAARSALAKFGKPAPPEEPAPATFDEMRARVAKIVRTKDEIHGYTILIWGAHAHLVDRFQSTFYLGFKGKTGAGKGTAVESCIALTPNGEVLGETTESYLATATNDGKAIGVEELDLLLERNPFIESLFRSGYRRGAYGGFKVPKKDGKGWEQERRSLFGPKVYDTHAGPSGHLLGRSVLIEMEPDDSVDRALDAEWKAEVLAPVRSWLSVEAQRALSDWPTERFRVLWTSPEFRERVRKLGGRGGRDHVIGALMLATCDMMGWSLDAELGTILAGRATIEEFGVEAEVLDALRDLVPNPAAESECLFGDLLARVNESRKKAGVGRTLTQKSLAAPLRELGFKRGGDGSDPKDEWFKSNAGANRNKVVLRPFRVLAVYTPENRAHQAHQARLYPDGSALDATDATDSGRYGGGPTVPSPETLTPQTEAKVPREFVEGVGGESPETPESPQRQDDRVTGVSRVPPPAPSFPRAEGQGREAARAAFDEAQREEAERP